MNNEKPESPTTNVPNATENSTLDGSATIADSMLSTKQEKSTSTDTVKAKKSCPHERWHGEWRCCYCGVRGKAREVNQPHF